MKDLRFEDLPKAIEKVLEKLHQIEEELNKINDNLQPKVPEELMTRQETVHFFKISLPTLWDWTKKGILKSYRTGNRVYYKRSELCSLNTRLIE